MYSISSNILNPISILNSQIVHRKSTRKLEKFKEQYTTKFRRFVGTVLIAEIFLLACATDIRTLGNSILFTEATWNDVSKVLRGKFPSRIGSWKTEAR